MRWKNGCAPAALAALWLAAPGEAQKPPASQAKWVSRVSISRLHEHFADRPQEASLSGATGHWMKLWESWITPEDVPARFRNRAFEKESIVVLDIGPAGKPSRCRPLRPGAEPSLDSLACELLMKRAVFDVRYEGPERPIAYRWVAGIRWRTIPAEEARPSAGFAPLFAPTSPPPPPPPPGSLPRYRGWPRLNWGDEVRFEPPADIQSAWPGGGEGTVGLDLVVSPEQGVTGCEIGMGSGTAALDAAACRVARTIGMRYHQPCEFCWTARIPLQVVWKKSGSHMRLPLSSKPPSGSAAQTNAYVGYRRAVGQPITRADYAKLKNRQITNRNFWVTLSVDEAGRPTRCVPQGSSGNPAVDARTCELLLKRMRYTTRTDVFGDPAADSVTARIDLAELL